MPHDRLLPARTERESTNESLCNERTRADDELSRLDAAISKAAVADVGVARKRADESVRRSRRRADRRAVGSSPEDILVRQTSRGEEDRALQVERGEADTAAREEREARELALSSFLLLERQHTDERLLTERRVVDEALGTRDSVLAMVCHDLRSMLTVIKTTASLLRRESLDGGPRLERVEGILAASSRMERLLGDLVDVAGIDAGKLSVVPAQRDVVEPILEAVKLFTPTAAARSIAIVVQAPSRPVVAHIDVSRLGQVLSNLIANALRYSGENEHITVGVEELETEVRISVSDSGCGIPPEQLELVFGRYWQSDRSDRRGLGLGLYISRSIMEAHHGRIWAESRVGAGCTFWLSVPRAPS